MSHIGFLRRNTLNGSLWLALFMLTIGGVYVYAGDEAKEVTLGYLFKPGHTQEYKTEFSQAYEVKGYSFQTLVDIEYTEKCVESINDTLFKMEITVNKVAAEMKRNDELSDVNIDEGMDQKTFTFSLNKNGMIAGLQPKGYIENEDEVMRVVNIIVVGSYPYLPGRKVAVGEEWQFDGSTLRDVKTDLDIESNSEFKAEEIGEEKDRNCMKVKRQSETQLSGRVENDSGTFLLDGTGEGKGEFYFDIENACVVKLKSDSEAEVISIDASSGSADERQTYTSNISYHLKKEIK